MKIEKPEIRRAMLGLIEGNGHPYSWSAIVNGYHPAEMAKCPFPVIPQYLAEVPRNTMRILGARVTHVWTALRRFESRGWWQAPEGRRAPGRWRVAGENA